MRGRFAGPAALLLVLVPLVVPSHAAGGCSTSVLPGNWIASTPGFPTGPKVVSLVASPDYAPDLIYASNGSVVMRSQDAGCTWKSVYDGASAAPLGGTATITSLFAPSSATGSSHLYVGLTASLGAIQSPALASSANQGGSWFASTGLASGMPAVGSVTEVTASPTVPDNAYAVVTSGLLGQATGTGDELLVSGDGGTTWIDRTPTGSDFQGTDVQPDALLQTRLYDVQSGAFGHSDDGGATFSSTRLVGPVSRLGSAQGAGGERLAAALTTAPAVATSVNRGLSWRLWGLPSLATDVAVAPLQDLVAASSATSTWLVGPGFPPFDIGAGKGVAQLFVSAPTTAGYAVTGVSNGKVVRLRLTDSSFPRVVEVHTAIPALLGAALQGVFPSLMLPATRTLSLPAGGTETVPYRLLVPRSPTPVDLMFLVDSTGSMGGVISDLAASLIRMSNQLDGAGLDVQFGVADFRDYPTAPRDSVDYPYKLDRRIGPAGADLSRAISAIGADGGGDIPEADLSAVVQSSTGQGQLPWIPKRQEAGYRPAALKFALIATDAPFHQNGDPYAMDNGSTESWPGPTMKQAEKALASHRIRAIGLAASTDPVNDMRQLATASGALAPAGGVDCNGDGVVDVRSGDPLVCLLSGSTTSGSVSASGPVTFNSASGSNVGLGSAVIAAVNGIVDPAPVTERVAHGADVAKIVGSGRTSVNLKADNELSFRVRLACPLGASADHAVSLVAAKPGRTLASASIDLVCGGVAVVPQVTLPQGDAVVPAVHPGVHVAAQANLQPPNPQANPQPNAQAQPNVNLQAGMAEQQQSQAQLAYAANRIDTDQVEAAAAIAGMATLSAAFGLAMRGRDARQVAHQGGEGPRT